MAADRIPVRVVILTGFEVGKDTGDAPGELQYWVEREHLNKTLHVRGAPHALRYNDDGIFASASGSPADKHLTTVPASELVMAIALDPRLDVSHAYWLVTGIAGIDPKQGSIGSAAWAANVVDGDAMREIARQDMPSDWPYGLFAIGTHAPDTLPRADTSAGGWGGGKLSYTMNYALNPRLARWAYDLSRKQVSLPDSKALADFRSKYKKFPKAQQPPRILEGATLASARYWHGAGRTHWARDWVHLWAPKDHFTTTAMEQAAYVGTLQRLSDQGLLDFDRVMMLRAASNYCMPPTGESVLATVGDESVGSNAAFESEYRTGAAVVNTLVSGWQRYRDRIPGASPSDDH